jgi:hypothetical protein
VAFAATACASVDDRSAVVLALCWVQPLVEQVPDRPGQPREVAANAGKSPETVGVELGLQLVSAVVSQPPLFVRPSFERA